MADAMLLVEATEVSRFVQGSRGPGNEPSSRAKCCCIGLWQGQVRVCQRSRKEGSPRSKEQHGNLKTCTVYGEQALVHVAGRCSGRREAWCQKGDNLRGLHAGD